MEKMVQYKREFDTHQNFKVIVPLFLNKSMVMKFFLKIMTDFSFRNILIIMQCRLSVIIWQF